MEKYIVKSAGHDLLNYSPMMNNGNLGINQKRFYLEIVKADLKQGDLLQDMVLCSGNDDNEIVISNIIVYYPLEGRGIYEVWAIPREGIVGYYFHVKKEWTIDYTLIESTLANRGKNFTVNIGKMENKVQEGLYVGDLPGLNSLSTQIGGEHYKQGSIQPIEYILANKMGFIEGCVVKYITRWKLKNGIEDLQKIKHYIDILIENEKVKTNMV